jgi:hypothetical protein
MTKTAKKKRKHHTVKERISYCQKWEKSGLSRRRFCELNKLSISTFIKWANEYLSKPTNRTRTKASKKSFLLPVAIDDSEIKYCDAVNNLSCTYISNGIKLELKLTLADVVNLITRLKDANTIIR